MAYLESLLSPGERIIRREHQHWFVLAWNARWAVVGIVVAIILLALRIATNGSGLLFDVLGWLTIALILGGLGGIAWGWMRYRNEEYVITTLRIVHAEGVINKKATDSSLEKINDASLTESFIGRIFGFGDLDIMTASESGIERLRMLRDAKAFKVAMVEAKSQLGNERDNPTSPPLRRAVEMPPERATPAPAAPAPAPMSGDEVTRTLASLGDLRDRGLLSPAEFEAKKTELLGRL